MKVVALREAKASLSGYIESAQEDRVLITKHGKPAALVIGVEGEDLEDLLTMGNPRFWEMVEARRASTKTLSIEEVRRRLGVPKKAESVRRVRPSGKTRSKRRAKR
jgi:prevent-host-death family protein